MNVVAFTFAMSDSVKGTSFSREESSVVVSMDANVKYGIITLKYLGSSITNMDVPIENTHFLLVILLLSYPCCDCYIVKETEATYLIAEAMMPRWTDNRKC